MTLIIIRFYEETQCIEIIEKADYQHQNTCLSLTNEWDSRHEEILRAKRFQTLFPKVLYVLFLDDSLDSRYVIFVSNLK